MARKGRWGGSLLPCMVETDLEQDHDVYWDVATMGWGCTGVYERAGRRVVSS
jgi:hypothetical protein